LLVCSFKGKFKSPTFDQKKVHLGGMTFKKTSGILEGWSKNYLEFIGLWKLLIIVFNYIQFNFALRAKIELLVFFPACLPFLC